MAKILVVDDEQSLSRVVSTKLRKDGFEADVANDGQEALDMILKNNYDLILLDLIMPEKTGFDVLEEMKAKGIKTPVIVTSNLSGPEDRKKVEELGAKEFLDKTEVPIFEMMPIINKYLGDKAIKKAPSADEKPAKKVAKKVDTMEPTSLSKAA